MLFIFTAIVMVICVINLTPNFKIFSKYGNNTLIFYIYHGLILTILFKIGTYYNITPSLLEQIVITTILIIGLAIFSNMRISHILLNPISYINSKLKQKS